MRKLLVGAVLTCGVVLLLGSALSARAMMVMAPPPGPIKVAQAQVIVTGQVVGMEDRDVEVALAPNSPQKSKYRIAILKVGEVLKGNVKATKMLKVGFLPPPTAGGPVGGPIGRPIIRPGGPGRFGVTLTVGQDGLFFMTKHASGDFYTLPMYYNFVSSQNKAAFDQELTVTRKTLKILNNVTASLKSNDAEERILAAAVLIEKYRTPQGSTATQPISAEESKLILKALLDGNWNLNAPVVNFQMRPLNLFGRLGLTQKDGFQPPQGATTPNAYPDAAQAWLKNNWQTYRIQRFVPGKGGLNQPGTGGPVQIQPFPGPGQIQPRPIQIQPGQPIQIQVEVVPPAVNPGR